MQNKKLKINFEKYRFEEKNHKHFINDKEATGTTTIVGVIDKPALIPWALKVAFEKLQKIGELTREAIDEAKQEPNNKKNEAGRFGTVVHAIAEYFNETGVIVPADSEELPAEILEISKDFSYKKKEKAQKLVRQYADWFFERRAKVLYVEQNVFSETFHVGGIFDMVLEIDGKVFIADFKTSSGVYPSQFVQMGGYELQLEEMAERGYIEPIKPSGYIVIHLPRKGNMTAHTKLDTRMYKKAFKACVYIYRLINDQLWAISNTR